MTNVPQIPRDLPARLDSFELTIRMDATLTVNGDQWFKPGAEGSMKWKGYEWSGQWVDPIPTEEELKVAYQLIQSGILAPVLQEVITAAQARLNEARPQHT